MAKKDKTLATVFASEEQTAAKPAAKKAALPRISVLERRLQNPFGDGSPAVRLKEQGWTLHIVNSALRPGRYHDVTRNKGWVPVEVGEIDGDPMDFGFDVKDGRIVRGERGQEVLVKMPTRDYTEIQMAKDASNRRQIGGRAVKQAAVDKAAKEFGDQAADLIDSTIEFRTSRSPVPLEGADEEA
jgi:hypothetical protein